MIGPEMQVRSGDRSHPPFRLRAERLCFVVGSSRGDDFVAVFVHRSSSGRGELRLLFRLLLDFSDLLTLSRRRANLHAQNDISNLRLCQRRDVHTETRQSY